VILDELLPAPLPYTFCRHGRDQEHVACLETHVPQPKKLKEKIGFD
jgi:hypothetical protein